LFLLMVFYSFCSTFPHTPLYFTSFPTRRSSDLISKVLLVGGSSRIPAVQEAVKKITGKEGFKGINPDECVAVGAAIQAGVLTGRSEEHTSELQSRFDLVCRLLLDKKYTYSKTFP